MLIDDEPLKDKSQEETKTRGLLLFVVLTVFAQLLIMNPNYFNTLLEQEVKEAYPALGETKWINLTNRTDEAFTFVLIDSGFKDRYLDKITRDTENPNPIAKKFETLLPLAHRFANNVQVVIYQFIHRAGLMMDWFWLLVPFFIAQIASAVYYWRIRAYSFGTTTKARMLILKKFSKTILLIGLIYFLIPAFYPPASPYLPVLMLIGLGVLMKKQIKTFQKFI
ncbi:DUF4400 domain-containing protein [Pseudoalteromonas spongiae]|uniref:DUF4400 domain-containing protein n=1 Tax=Pseudoalteromonas spongiae TaxID=298657 RepID=UPI000C2D1877|nr:DUF4400 domain-containing protein [Pseudoalteromonas spongiae]